MTAIPMQARVPRIPRRALMWLGVTIGGVLAYTLILWADFVLLQNLPVPGALRSRSSRR